MLQLVKKAKRVRETPLAKRIRMTLNRIPGVWCSQNVVGLFWNAAGIRVRCGLGKGSPDIVGVLAPHGRAFALEVKTPHGVKAHPEVQAGQHAWRRVAERYGIQCAKVTSEADAIEAIDRFRRCVA